MLRRINAERVRSVLKNPGFKKALSMFAEKFIDPGRETMRGYVDSTTEEELAELSEGDLLQEKIITLTFFGILMKRAGKLHLSRCG